MSEVPKKVVNWLYSVLQPQYLHKEVAFTDIYRFLAVYLGQGFKIRTAVYTSSLGVASLLVNLYGSINCKNVEVPLSIWVPLNYPYANDSVAVTEPNGVPLVYVLPGGNMLIQPGNNIDLQGRFYHPYLSLWHQEFVSGTNGNYNLVNLMTCIISTFNRDPPLRHADMPPQLPPKPVLSPNATGKAPLRRETTGPPLPDKPGALDNSVPLKYRSPLPIPPETPQNGSRTQQAYQVPGFVHTDYQMPQVPSESRVLPEARVLPVSRALPGRITSPPQLFVTYSSLSPSRDSPAPVAEIEDLMDKVSLDNTKSAIPPAILQAISNQINAFLNLNGEDNVNSIVGAINDNSNRINALHDQLEHHNKQAAANRANLDRHADYLVERLDAIQTLNRDLGQLDKVNTASTDEIHTNVSGQKMRLEDVITPDLKLVNQLYEVTADIKACKDTLKLIGGGFQSEEEMVNDTNLEACVKAARGLGRDLFWLEVTKQNIAKTMGLS